MGEKELYRLLELVEEFEDETDGYYLTVEELKAHNVEDNLEEYLVILAYFASDPFGRQNIEGKNDKDYIETVKYAKRLLYKMNVRGE